MLVLPFHFGSLPIGGSSALSHNVAMQDGLMFTYNLATMIKVEYPSITATHEVGVVTIFVVLSLSLFGVFFLDIW